MFLLYDTALVNLLARDLLSKFKGLIQFASGGDLTLEFPQNLNLIYKFFTSSVSPKMNFKEILNLIEVPGILWATSITDIGRIKSAEHIKIQVDTTELLSKLSQYVLKS